MVRFLTPPARNELGVVTVITIGELQIYFRFILNILRNNKKKITVEDSYLYGHKYIPSALYFQTSIFYAKSYWYLSSNFKILLNPILLTKVKFVNGQIFCILKCRNSDLSYCILS